MHLLPRPLYPIVFACLPALAFAAEDAWQNPLKKALRNGQPVVGMTITVPSADIVLQAARLGFDFVWIEMEHGPITLESARNLVLATQGTGMMPIIRVPHNELWLAKRALDTGAMGIVFPFTSTPELARQAVEACKFPPHGRRGSGPTLPALRWPAPQGYADFADDNIMVIIIIEEKQAVENIDAILDVPGIDVVFIGPNDLSFSYGDRGAQTAQVKEAIQRVFDAAKRRGLPVGRTSPVGDVRGYIEDGFQFFMAPNELNFIAAGARPYLEAAGKSAPEPEGRPFY
jgi:2-keto-3-deoxy-L-rhamnonate aldolase RhmA